MFLYEKEVDTMTHKQIEQSREARLWLGQIIIPAATLVVSALSIPEVRQVVVTKVEDVKKSIERKRIKRKLKKVEES